MNYERDNPGLLSKGDHIIKMRLKPFDNYDKVIREFSISHYRGSELSFCDARKIYYSSPEEIFFKWSFEFPSVEYRSTSKAFVFSCSGIDIGSLSKSTRVGSDYSVFSSLSASRLILGLSFQLNNGAYFHLNKMQYSNSDDFIPIIDDPHEKGYPLWAKDRLDIDLLVSVNYEDYKRLIKK